MKTKKQVHDIEAFFGSYRVQPNGIFITTGADGRLTGACLFALCARLLFFGGRSVNTFATIIIHKTNAGDAYVVFESEEQAQAAMQAMNKQTLISRWIDLFPVRWLCLMFDSIPLPVAPGPTIRPPPVCMYACIHPLTHTIHKQATKGDVYTATVHSPIAGQGPGQCPIYATVPMVRTTAAARRTAMVSGRTYWDRA